RAATRMKPAPRPASTKFPRTSNKRSSTSIFSPAATNGGIHQGGLLMIGTTRLLAGISLVFACGAATTANAQLAVHKDLTLPIAITMAQTAAQMCTGQGYKVSVHVVGRNAEVVVAMRGDG